MNQKCRCLFAARLWRALGLGVLILGASLPAAAKIEVRFLSPDKFIDAGESALDRERMLPLLEEHLRALAARHVKGEQDLVIEVRELDLAGEMEPHGRTRERVRVLRSVTPPMIELRFTLSEAGVVLKQGDVRLVDLAYQDHVNRYASSDVLRYEKQMLDEWFANEFGAQARP